MRLTKLLGTLAALAVLAASGSVAQVGPGTNQPSTYLPSGAYPTIVPAYTGTFTLTSGSNTFTVDATTAAEISAGMSVISTAGFNTGTQVASIVGTTVTTVNAKASANALVSGATAVSFGLNRFSTPYVGATDIMAREGYFGDAAQGNSTWNYAYTNVVDYPHIAAVVGLKGGAPAAYFASHTSTLTSAGNSSTYGAFLNVINDNPTYANNIWGFYVQCEQAPGAAQAETFCAELSPVNFGAAGTAIDPYTNNSGKNVETMRLDAGNGASGLSEGSDIIHMMGNNTKVLHGIDVASDLLDMTADATAPFLAMPNNVSLAWYTAPGTNSWKICSSGGNGQTLNLGAANAAFSVQVQAPVGSVTVPGLQLGSSGGGYGFYQSGSSVLISAGSAEVAYFNANDAALPVGFVLHWRGVSCATGAVSLSESDRYIAITTMPASGNCAVTLAASPLNGKIVTVEDGVGTAATHNIVVSPSAGNISGAGSYTISTNYGSWTGHYASTQFLTEAHQ